MRRTKSFAAVLLAMCLLVAFPGVSFGSANGQGGGPGNGQGIIVPAAPAFAVPATVPVPAYGSVQGSVYGTDRTPLQGAAVTATGSVYSTVTDTSGHYAFPALPVGTYTLTAAAEGYAAAASEPFEITEGGNVYLDMTLREPLVLVESGQARAVVVVSGEDLEPQAGGAIEGWKPLSRPGKISITREQKASGVFGLHLKILFFDDV